jgi:hypothetical protein
LYRDTGELYGQAEALHHLASTLQALSKHDQARRYWKDSLAILDALLHPLRDKVKTCLSDSASKNP